MLNFSFRTSIYLLWFQILPLLAFSQLLKEKKEYTRYDSLLGTITPMRAYDVTFYKLNLDIDIEKKNISGTAVMEFISQDKMDVLQLDLFENYQIQELSIGGVICKYTREKNHIFVQTKNIIKESNDFSLKIKYQGTPPAAKNAPWDGGFVWKKDSMNRHWIGVACEGLGASSWWPCKDHWSDEPDRGVDISIIVPEPYKAVSNGKLILQQKLPNGKSEWRWKVTQPINLYNVTLNIAQYKSINQIYTSKVNGKTLNMAFWVLDYNLEKARKHFQQVQPMMDCYEAKLGPYPFYEDGYQLVETPYLGMEHQSCVAYGNKYFSGYLGNKNYTGGHDFDYIIIHETGHEWFGNNITASDNADMWIHEALTTYTESIYAECIYGKGAGDKYVNNMKRRVRNKKPVQGDYGVGKEGDGDMYAKGALFFHTLRYQINNDKIWDFILKDMGKTFGKRTTSYEEIVQYFNKVTKRKLDPLFSAYIQYAELPKVIQSSTIENGIKSVKLNLYHPQSDLSMRIYYTVDGKENQILLENSKPSILKLPAKAVLEVNDEKGYFEFVEN
jgi:aminopeptidase N